LFFVVAAMQFQIQNARSRSNDKELELLIKQGVPFERTQKQKEKLMLLQGLAFFSFYFFI
jgi:hypothetical protein